MANPEEIWAARLQRELVALSSATNEDDPHSNPIGALPPFMKMKDYKLDIEHGFCQVSFMINIDGVKMPAVSTNENNQSRGVVDPTLDQVQHGHGHGHATLSNLALASSPTKNEDGKDEKTSNANIDDAKESKETRQYEEDNQNQVDAFHVQVLITLDASLKRNLADFHPSTSYPFQPPICIINSGAEYLPKDQHSIQNGEEVQLDCDWTPSLHLNDAALNVAVKIKESIKRGEPILEFTKKSAGSFTASLPNSLLDEVSQDFNKASHAISGFFSDLKTKASHIADELDQAVVGPSRDESASTEEKSRKGFKFRKGTKLRKDEEQLKVVTEENVNMGDSIDLAESPWNHALGMYPCKAIRRPTFMSTAMEVTGHMDDESTKVRNNYTSLSDSDGDPYHYGDCAMPDNYLNLHAGGLREVTAAGLSGAGSIFRSFTKSAKSLVEESFLMLTNNLIMEITCNKFSVAAATVKFAIPVSHLLKLKFKREESVSLFFKQAPDDPIIYMCADSADAVKQIQNILKSHGVKGKHTNATMQNVILEAVEILDDIQVREHLLEKDPSKQMVTDIMDLYRQAAEKFELADDARHEQVVTMMKTFLAKPIVAGILDDSFVSTTVPNATETGNADLASETQGSRDDVPKVESYTVETSLMNSIKSEASSAPTVDANDNHIDEGQLKAEEEELRKAMQDAESMIQSAHDDLADLTIDDIDDDDLNFNDGATLERLAGDAESGDDVVSEFADMLADADKELSELIGSSS